MESTISFSRRSGHLQPRIWKMEEEVESLLRPKRGSLELRNRVLPGVGTYSCSLKVNKSVKSSGVCVHRMAYPDPIQIRACNSKQKSGITR